MEHSEVKFTCINNNANNIFLVVSEKILRINTAFKGHGTSNGERFKFKHLYSHVQQKKKKKRTHNPAYMTSFFKMQETSHSWEQNIRSSLCN